LTVYNIAGMEMQSINLVNIASGKHEFNFNGSNLPSGIYFYKLTAGNFSETKKMILIK